MTAHTSCTAGCVSEDCSHLMRQQDEFREVGRVPLCTEATLSSNWMQTHRQTIIKTVLEGSSALNWRLSSSQAQLVQMKAHYREQGLQITARITSNYFWVSHLYFIFYSFFNFHVDLMDSHWTYFAGNHQNPEQQQLLCLWIQLLFFSVYNISLWFDANNLF